MQPISLNMYDGIYAGNVKHVVVAATMEEAAKVLNANYQRDPELLQCIQENISVRPPAQEVSFTAVVAGQGAELAGCSVSPTTSRVLSGTEVIFEAKVGGAFKLKDWRIDGVVIPGKTSLIEKLVIPPSQSVVQVTAYFET